MGARAGDAAADGTGRSGPCWLAWRYESDDMIHVLAAFIAIPYGLSALMRGSDGLNRGTHSFREGAVLAAAGGTLIFTSLAMLLGFRYAGFLVIVALIAIAALGLRQKYRRFGRLEPADIIGRALFTGVLILLIAAGI